MRSKRDKYNIFIPTIHKTNELNMDEDEIEDEIEEESLDDENDEEEQDDKTGKK